MAPDSEYTFVGEDIVTNVIPAVTEDVVIPAVIEHVEAVYETVQVPVLDAEGNETGEFTEERQLVSEAYDVVIEPERVETVEVTPEIVVQERLDFLNIQTPYEIITRYDGTVPEGTSYVETKGDYGMIVVPITITIENGVQVSTVRGEEQFVIAPTTEVVIVGTQKVATVVTNTLSETTTTPYKVITVEDNSMFVGETVVDQVGQEGTIVKTYTQTTTNGVVGEKVQVGESVETASVNQIVRVGTKEVTQEVRESAVAFETVYQYDENAYTDSTVVTTEGQSGTKATTYDVTYVKGVKVSETAVAEEVTVAPVTKVITVGTKAIETTGTETVTEDVAFETVYEYDVNMVSGEEVVKTEGQTGTKAITYDVTYSKGEEVSRTVASEVVTKAPVNKVVVIGAQNIEVKQEVVTISVAYEREFNYDDTKPTGFYEVTSAGKEGVKETTYNVTYVNGVKTSEEKVSARITVAPINQVVTVGTKEVVEDVVEVKQEVVSEEIPFTTSTEIDSTKVNTYEAVKQAGVAGITETTYNVTYVNGVKTTSVVASTNVVKEMVAEIIVKGDQPVISYGAEYTANENEVDFPILYIENAELEVGVENIISAGTKGYELVTYKDKLSDGVKVDTVEVSRTTVQAVRQVVEVGTKVVEVVPTTPQTAEQLQATIDMTLLNNEFLTLINEKRVSLGRVELVYDATIQDEAAQRVSDEVSALDFYAPDLGLDHNRPDGSPYYSLLDPEKSSAENLLLNTLSASGETYSVNEKELATLIYNQWKSSNGHYANMINPQLNANTVAIQLVDKDGFLVYIAVELLINNL